MIIGGIQSNGKNDFNENFDVINGQSIITANGQSFAFVWEYRKHSARN